MPFPLHLLLANVNRGKQAICSASPYENAAKGYADADMVVSVMNLLG
jgi:hypothetical protein